VKKGIDVTVYTTNVGLDDKMHDTGYMIQVTRFNIQDSKEINIDGVKVTYFRYIKFFEFLGTTGWQFSPAMASALNKNLKNFDIVYIVSTWNFPVAASSYFCRKQGNPYIISPRGHLYSDVLKKKSWKKFPYYKLITKRDLMSASAIHYTTEDEAERCHSSLCLKNRAIIIPNGIDLSEFNDLPTKENIRERYPFLKDKKIILFLGRIHWIKGLDILIKAYAKLAKERPDVHLLIAGGDEANYGAKVIQWLKEYDLKYNDISTPSSIMNHESCILYQEAKVTFTGMLTGSAKLEAFAGSDIFVLPSYSENFGMSVVEAMACGVPVVISNKVGIHKEVERNKAGIIVDTNAESLYQGIKLLLDNSELRQQIAINGKRMVEEYYDIDKVADRMIKMYEEILKCKVNV
jgi:glycosyltransferase involved in cell wall biosynthesis